MGMPQDQEYENLPVLGMLMNMKQDLNESVPAPSITFVDAEASKEFDCGICLNVIDDPVDIGCKNGHIFFNLCININLLLQANNDKETFGCPNCRCLCNKRSIRRM